MRMLSHPIACSAVRLFKHIRNSSDKVQYYRTVRSRIVRLLFLRASSALHKRRGWAQPQVPQPQLVNYIRDDYVKRAGSLTASRSSDPRGDPA
jgi:hypothetical protein